MKIKLGKLLAILGQIVAAVPTIVEAVKPIIDQTKRAKATNSAPRGSRDDKSSVEPPAGG